jgi:thioester reductase-like protein
MGFLHDGELYVCGRYKDMLIVRGLNYYPQDIEALVEEDDRIRKGSVAAFAREQDGGERLVVVAELRDARRVPDPHDLNRRLLAGLGVTAANIVFIEPRTIPKTSSGKIARHAVQERWLDGWLDGVTLSSFTADLDGPDVPARRTWLHRFGLSGDETDTLENAGLDSLRLVEFSVAIQEELKKFGSADLAEAIDLRVLQKIVISELFDLLDQVSAATPYARLRLRSALSSIEREHRAFEASMMQKDTSLRFDLAILPGELSPNSIDEGGILLTGGTGFFGPFLLASLLEQTTEKIYVLARGDGAGDAMRRIHEGLMTISPDGACPEGWEGRVLPVCGDLSAPNLGLDPASWRALAERTHTVYHNAATVNYLQNYESMREANIGGTNEVIRLTMSHRPKILNHISTTFIFGWSVKETLFETDTNTDMDRLDFGYSQSKWVSEQVVFDAMRRGLQARVFRPALLTPSVLGGGSNFDISIRLLAFMIDHGLGTTAQNQVSFCPADLAAGNIVAISRVPESIGRTFHVTRDEYASLAEITEIISELTGRTFRYHTLHDFVHRIIERCQAGDILYPLREFIERSVDNISAMEFKRYDNSNYRHFRDNSLDCRADPPLQDVVLGILRFMRKRSLIPQ